MAPGSRKPRVLPTKVLPPWSDPWSLPKQYGGPIPIVYGTGRVRGIPLWMGAATNVYDLQARDTSQPSGWRKKEGNVAPTIIGLCEGEIRARSGRVWRGGDCLTARLISRPEGVALISLVDELTGDGTETEWTLRAALTTRDESYSVASQIMSFTVPDPDTLDAAAPDQGVMRQIGAGDWEAMTKVGSAPTAGQYTYSAGVYGFNSGTGPKQVKVRRDLTQLAAWIYPVPYAYTAQVRFEALSVPDDGLPDDLYEVWGVLADITDSRAASGPEVGAYDCDPADVVLDLLCDPRRGLGWDTALVDVDHGPDGSTASGYRTWCAANGFVVSRAITDRAPTADLVEELLDATWSRACWSEGKFKVIPLGEAAVGIYTPAGIVANIGPDDLVVERGDDPVSVQRVPPDQTYTVCPVAFPDRNKSYEEVAVEWPLDDPFISETSSYEQPAKQRRADPETYPWISTPAHAARISWLLGMRSLYVRNTYRFTLGPRWARLEPGDLLALTEPSFGISGERVRITSIEERDTGELEVYAEEAPFSTAPIPLVTVQLGDGLSSSPVVPMASDASGAARRLDAMLNGSIHGGTWGIGVEGDGFVSMTADSMVATITVAPPTIPVGFTTIKPVVQATQVLRLGTQHWALGHTAVLESWSADGSELSVSFWYNGVQSAPNGIPNWEFNVSVAYFYS